MALCLQKGPNKSIEAGVYGNDQSKGGKLRKEQYYPAG